MTIYLTKKVNDMVIDRNGLVEVTVQDPGFMTAEAGPSAAARITEHATGREENREHQTFEVQGYGWF